MSASHKTLDFGFKKADYNRFQFLKQSVDNLRDKLKIIGGDLLILSGIPEDILPKLVKENSISTIYAEDEYAYEELQIIKKLKGKINGECELNLTWGKTLYHIDDIPYTIDKIPATSKANRINTGKQAEVRAPFLAPETITVIANFPESKMSAAEIFEFELFSEIQPYVNGGEDKASRKIALLHF